METPKVREINYDKALHLAAVALYGLFEHDDFADQIPLGWDERPEIDFEETT